MGKRELTAAGIIDPRLRASYLTCQRINAEHGKTYYLATRLLPPAKRPAVHALYAFARSADDIVDSLHGPALTQRSAQLDDYAARFFADVTRGHSSDPVLAAAVDTILTFDIPISYFEAFIESMQMDLSVSRYQTYAELDHYVYGSAVVVGLQMVRVLQPRDEAAYGYAADLGRAFQLANFIRDVGEDLERDRIYLPLTELAEFGVSESDVVARRVDDNFRAAMDFQIHRVRDLESASRPGIALLPADAQPCIETARILYCGIVDEVENIDYQVFTQRAKVPMSRRLSVALRAWQKSRRARHR